MDPDHQIPWALTETQMPPNGLRECVLRIGWLPLSRVQPYADRMSTDLVNRVARWRLRQPELFNELHALVTQSSGSNVH